MTTQPKLAPCRSPAEPPRANYRQSRWLIFKGFQPEAYRGLPLHHRSFQEA